MALVTRDDSQWGDWKPAVVGGEETVAGGEDRAQEGGIGKFRPADEDGRQGAPHEASPKALGAGSRTGPCPAEDRGDPSGGRPVPGARPSGRKPHRQPAGRLYSPSPPSWDRHCHRHCHRHHFRLRVL